MRACSLRACAALSAICFVPTSLQGAHHLPADLPGFDTAAQNEAASHRHCSDDDLDPEHPYRYSVEESYSSFPLLTSPQIMSAVSLTYYDDLLSMVACDSDKFPSTSTNAVESGNAYNVAAREAQVQCLNTRWALAVLQYVARNNKPATNALTDEQFCALNFAYVGKPDVQRPDTASDAGNRFYILLNSIGAAILLNRTLILPDKGFPRGHHILPELLDYRCGAQLLVPAWCT
eukprot:scaffold1399_cov410-Prasinococcus_capsulatus_cf.AAC.47